MRVKSFPKIAGLVALLAVAASLAQSCGGSTRFSGNKKNVGPQTKPAAEPSPKIDDAQAMSPTPASPPSTPPPAPVITPDNETLPPGAPLVTLSGAPDSLSRQVNVLIKVSGENVERYVYGIASGGDCTAVKYKDEVSKQDPIKESLAELPDGRYVLCVLGINSAKVRQEFPTYTTWVKDTTAPRVELTGLPVGSSNAKAVTFTALPSSEVAGFRYLIVEGGKPCPSTLDGYSPFVNATSQVTASLESLLDGNVALCAVGIDGAGNEQLPQNASRYEWTKDSLPGGAEVSLLLRRIDNADTLSAVVAGTDVVKYRYAIVVGGAECPDLSKYSEPRDVSVRVSSPTAAFPQGEVSVCALGIDSSGNLQDTSRASRASYIKDTAAPTIQFGALPSSAVNPIYNVTASFVDADAVSYEYIVAAGLECGSGTRTRKLRTESISGSTAALPTGKVTLCAWATDAVGNKQASPTVARWDWEQGCTTASGSLVLSRSIEARSGFSAAVAPAGTMCSALHGADTRWCNAGTWSAWSGTHTVASCTEASCTSTSGAPVLHAGSESRSGFSASTGPIGASCSSLQGSDTRTCSYGIWSSWSGAHTYASCTNASCTGLNGQAFTSGQNETRSGYTRSTGEVGQACSTYFGEDARTCTYGQWGAWSGSHSFATCTPASCTDGSLTFQSGTSQSRTGWTVAQASAGTQCSQFQGTDSRQCTLGQWGSWSGGHVETACASYCTPSEVQCSGTSSRVCNATGTNWSTWDSRPGVCGYQPPPPSLTGCTEVPMSGSTNTMCPANTVASGMSYDGSVGYKINCCSLTSGTQSLTAGSSVFTPVTNNTFHSHAANCATDTYLVGFIHHTGTSDGIYCAPFTLGSYRLRWQGTSDSTLTFYSNPGYSTQCQDSFAKGLGDIGHKDNDIDQIYCRGGTLAP